MAVYSAAQLLREARHRRGMTQEEASHGICTPQALSRMECGTANVSPATFAALMHRFGSPHTRFPAFTDRNDFECRRSLSYARTHLDAWQLSPALKELLNIQELHWADSKAIYQEWLFLHCRLQFRSYRCHHRNLYHTLLSALHMTRPAGLSEPVCNPFFSRIELEILIALAQEALYLGNRDTCAKLIHQIESSPDTPMLSPAETARLAAEFAIVRVKYLFSLSQYENAFRLAERHRRQMILHMESAPLYELTFLSGLCAFRSGRKKEADPLIRSAFHTCRHLDICYASACLLYLKHKTSYPVTEQMSVSPKIPFKKYPAAVFDPSLPFLSDDSGADRPRSYTLGDVIREFRTEQGVSQKTLCYGLCSKSKLSKIENKTLQPDIALTETLLGRLGISGQIFSFYGSDREVRFYSLKAEAMRVRSFRQRQLIFRNIEEMESLTEEPDRLWKQECLAARAMQNNVPAETVTLLKDALQHTLPQFDIHQILHYRLSWKELNIIGNLAHSYGKLNTTSGSGLSILWLLQLDNYSKRIPMDISLQVNLLSMTGYIHCHLLYHAGNFKAAAGLPVKNDLPVMRYALATYSFYLFYYCLSLGKCGRLQDCLSYGTLALNISYLAGFDKNVLVLKRCFADDFGLSITDP